MVIGKDVKTIGNGAFMTGGRLTTVYYTGTEEEWSQISIGSSNERLSNATIYYNYQSE